MELKQNEQSLTKSEKSTITNNLSPETETFIYKRLNKMFPNEDLLNPESKNTEKVRLLIYLMNTQSWDKGKVRCVLYYFACHWTKGFWQTGDIIMLGDEVGGNTQYDEVIDYWNTYYE